MTDIDRETLLRRQLGVYQDFINLEGSESIEAQSIRAEHKNDLEFQLRADQIDTVHGILKASPEDAVVDQVAKLLRERLAKCDPFRDR